MKTLKRIFLLIFILMFTFNIGCSKVDGKDMQSIKAPNNEKLSIEGTWKIDNIKIIDDDIENKSEIMSQKDSLINITYNKISIFNKSYQDPNFKLKVVDGSYIISYELNLKLNDIMETNNKVDIISIIDSNRLLGEFIIADDNNGYLFYSGLLLKLVKEDTAIMDINDSVNKIETEVLLDEDYESDVGVMLALKTPRKSLENGDLSKISYRTLWISFKDNSLQPIVQKNNIIFPRLNGIWTVENEEIEDNNIYYEYFIVKPIESKDAQYLVNDVSSKLYKDINFISNDYISIESFQGDNLFSIYSTIPVDNINSFEGLSIEEIYANESKEKFEKDYNESLEKLSLQQQNSILNIIDYTNFTIKRVEGKWTLVSRFISENSNDKDLEFKLSINPSKNILNYDTLLIPWKELKSKFPFIEDAYTSPTGRMAIIIFNNKLFVYELEERSIKGNPLAVISLNENETVIMSEWASGSYVDTWARAFKGGKTINMKED